MWRLLALLRFTTPHDRKLAAFIRSAFGVQARDLPLYRQALRHGSATEKGATGLERSNERLEFLGDAILDAVIARYIYEKHDDLSEGELTKLKSQVVSRRTLNELGERLGVEEHLDVRMGNQPVQQTLIGNAVEALIGALYLDRGYRTTEKAVLRLLHEQGIEERMYDLTDFKSKLHEHCQKKKRVLRFDVIKEKAHANDVYEIAVFVDDRNMGSGIGKSKKGAEQAAAREACRRIFGDS
ncbi:MAG: ribonuclease III [Flavobacteriales bacterium]